jgi:hypothetical protein
MNNPFSGPGSPDVLTDSCDLSGEIVQGQINLVLPYDPISALGAQDEAPARIQTT